MKHNNEQHKPPYNKNNKQHQFISSNLVKQKNMSMKND